MSEKGGGGGECDEDESGFEPEEYQITLARRPAPIECSVGKEVRRSPRPVTRRWCPDRRESHPHRVVVCPHRSVLVDHGSECGDAVLCASLLSYGARWRAANAHARLKKTGRAGENRTRVLEVR